MQFSAFLVSKHFVVIPLVMLIFFLSSLQKFSSFQMESMANVNYMSPSSGSTLQIFGDLGLVQREALGHRGTDTRYNVSICTDYLE